MLTVARPPWIHLARHSAPAIDGCAAEREARRRELRMLLEAIADPSPRPSLVPEPDPGEDNSTEPSSCGAGQRERSWTR
jgi:hypothetical protein